MHPNLQHDEYILEEIGAGKSWALEVLFEKYYTSLCRFAMRFTDNHEDAEELVVDVFVDIWKRHETLAISKSIRVYLYAAVKYKALEHIKNTRHKTFLSIDDYSSEALYENVDPNEVFAAKETQQYYLQAVKSLPAQCQLIFTMHKMDGLKYAEIAEILNISVKTVENQMGKALKHLRSYLLPGHTNHYSKTIR